MGQSSPLRLPEGQNVLQRVRLPRILQSPKELTFDRFCFVFRITQEQIHSASRTHHNDLQPWTTRNLAGRGVLIDYASYAQRQGISVEAFSTHQITVADIEATAEEQGVTLRAGDVLFMRTGFVAAYKNGDDSRRKLAAEGNWIGISQGEETAKWLWEKQFAAVAADNPAFEMIRKSPSHITIPF